jgi:hypothetical protein
MNRLALYSLAIAALLAAPSAAQAIASNQTIWASF